MLFCNLSSRSEMALESGEEENELEEAMVD